MNTGLEHFSSVYFNGDWPLVFCSSVTFKTAKKVKSAGCFIKQDLLLNNANFNRQAYFQEILLLEGASKPTVMSPVTLLHLLLD